MIFKLNKILTILLLILTTNIWACSCLGIDDYYSFFKNNKTSFVGKVIAVTNKGSYNAYEFQVINKLRTSFAETVIVTNKNNAAGCTVTFQMGQTYILDPNKFEGEYNIARCAYIKSSLDKSFSEDTLLISLLAKDNVFINSHYFKGQINKGKRNGLWTYYYGDSASVGDVGIYIDDKKDGKWTDMYTETYYKKGKFIKMIELIDDSLKIKVETLPNSRTMYYSDGKIYKKLTKNTYTVFSKNGNKLETAKVKKNGYIVEWLYYNEDGTIKKHVRLEDSENSYDSYDEFYYIKEHYHFVD